jgi:glycosyltransferase involved in cell wall biosynthesis
MKTKLDTNPVLAQKTVVMHNFVDPVEQKEVQKKDYVLYFGRYSQEKGIATLVQAAKELPEVPFVFAGSGLLEHLLEGVPNIKNVGFQRGETLETLIREARFTVYPSEWYENCPFSVMESQMYGTPVLGVNIGGIPELIRIGETGELFESGNIAQMKEQIRLLWCDREKLNHYTDNCRDNNFGTLAQYAEKLDNIIH